MIWIRADANSEIGTGHVMRCLSVAAELKKLGARVCFLAADENPVPLLEKKGQEYRILHSDYRNMESELGMLENLFREEGGDFFLADSYFVTREYFRRIRAYRAAEQAETGVQKVMSAEQAETGVQKVMSAEQAGAGTRKGMSVEQTEVGSLKGMPVGYMDDKGLTGLPVDVLINYNIFAEAELYGELPRGTRLLLGPQYAPLREEFRNRGYQVRARASRVLVTTGGSDRYNLAGRFLREALGRKETAGLEYCVVSGAYNIHLNDLKELEKKHANIQVLCGVGNMADVMLECDIAVTAGGSTMYELSAIGVPIICFSFVDNQEGIVEGFCKRELTYYGGNYLLQGDFMLTEAAEKLGKLAADKELRRSFSERQRQVADGLGAARLARELTGIGWSARE